ncbi:hypothetical protein CA11_29070 [Gimesia maris]|uniref:hypothetical protein n=1 Tax=Gimesia maris TaxID=122 RepID=UPI0011896520|nr:hypothetical protein [Gimesia maris]QDU15087.1 hypothetical protein CA11_29070 [Gimesia maris]
MFFNALFDSGRHSLTNMIGWLSLCLVAAGWGAEFDTTIRDLWSNIGLFGLAAMFALKVVQWSRLKNQQMVTESRVVIDLERISRGRDSSVFFEAELDRLAQEESQQEILEYGTIESESHASDAELVLLLSSWGQVQPQFEPKGS